MSVFVFRIGGGGMEVAALAVSSHRKEAIVALYRVHYGPLVRLGYLLTSDNELAEELAQEAFVRTWRSWGRIRDEGSAHFYLRKTLVNLARSSLRRRLVDARRRHLLISAPAFEDSPGNIDLSRALKSLPPGQRSCIVLRYYEQMTEREVAAALGISVGSVKSQTHKALKKLGVQLADNSEQGGAIND